MILRYPSINPLSRSIRENSPPVQVVIQLTFQFVQYKLSSPQRKICAWLRRQSIYGLSLSFLKHRSESLYCE